ncbi:uncharacterized protein NEMAJ01_1477 [Nematocida major]|uniref:uncharacterized protein n=1 Tax=Nematocida major TaxID=1912982 RepID=UPI002007950E|nr:uncharacterized protein NEMAJ01_1477 [Nematocida major]KAH9386581.1 hypothetical protein NEMAJ01_1477 [Nematocida major]
MTILNMLERLSYHLAGPHRRAFYGTLDRCLEKEEVQKDEVHLVRVCTMKMYSLATDGHIAESLRVYCKCVKERAALLREHQIESAMLKESLILMDRVEEVETAGLSESEKYEVFLLRGDLAGCRKSAISLLKTHPMLAMGLFLVEAEKHPGTTPASLQLLLKRVTVANSLITALYRKKVPYSVLRPHIRRDLDTSFVFLMKALLLGGEDISEFVGQGVDGLLDLLDDWEVYEHAMKKGISVREREDSINSLRFQMEVQRTKDAISRFILAGGSVGLCKKHIEGLPKCEKQALIEGLPACARMKVEYYQNHSVAVFGESLGKCMASVGDFVFVVGALLADRTEQSLMDSLVLCYAKKTAYDSAYQVQLLLCVLYRYLCMYDAMLQEYISMSVQTVQLEGMTYIWSDLQILLGEDEPALKEQYEKNRLLTLGTINASLLGFIKKEEYAQVGPLLEYKQALVNSSVHRQIVENKFFCLDRLPAIENILVPESRYIFEKVMQPPREKKDATLLTIHSMPVEISRDKVQEMLCKSIEKIRQFVEVPESIHEAFRMGEVQERAWKSLRAQ